MRTKTFRVRPRQRFEFPADMLRYDACWPASEQDSVKLACAARSIKDFCDIFVAGNDWWIELRTAGAGPTAARWLSFGWEVC